MRSNNNKKVVIINVPSRAKMRLILLAAIVLVVVISLSYQLPATKTWTHWTLPLSGKIIAIDPGHGGADGGAVSRDGLVEKDVNLAISLFLRDYLQEAGALVIMTREVDKDLADPGTRNRKTQDLHRRAELIRQSGATMLISIHMNSMPSSRWSGAQTFYYNNNRDDSKYNESQALATFIQDEIRLNLNNTTRIAKSINDIYVLENVHIPAALVEVGFLSNPAEASLLADEKYRKKVAAAIYRGIMRYASDEKLGSP